VLIAPLSFGDLCMEATTLIGWLRRICSCPEHAEPIEHQTHYSFELEGKDYQQVEIQFATPEQEANTPVNVRIALLVIAKDGYYEVFNNTKYFSYVDDYAAGEIPSKKHLALLVQVPLDAADDVKAAAQKRGDVKAKAMQEYYQHYSKFEWDVEVRAYAYPSDTDPKPNMFGAPTSGNFMKTITDFDPNYRMIWGGSNSGWCGHAQVNGPYSVTYANCGLSTMLHEWGHSLGLHHAATIDELGNYKEYGDKTSVMGGEETGLNSHNLIKLGLEGNREIKIISASEQVLIAPIELHEHALFDNEYQTVVVKRLNFNDLYISIRKDKGTIYPIRHTPQRVYIHENDEYGRSVQHLPNLEPTKTKTVNGVTFNYVSYDDVQESAIIDIIIDGVKPVNKVSHPKVMFPELLPNMDAKQEYTGVWYNRLHQKQGYDIQVKNGRLLFFWYTFSENNDALRYYFGTADTIEQARLGFDLYTTKNGTFKAPESGIVEKIGTARLSFFDETRGVFNYSTIETGRGSVEIFPLANSSEFTKTGCYANPAKKASGFVGHIFHEGETCVLFWYTYGADKMQKWYLCSGPRSKDNPDKYELEIFESKGGARLHVRDAFDTMVGTATVEFNGDNLIEVDYSFDGANGTGKETAQRLF